MFDHWGATDAEIAAALPGDDLITGSVQVGTRAIDIASSPDLVFDFLAQMGFGRAGWYSYDLLDNLGRRSASTVNREWTVEQPGEMVPGGPIEFLAAVVDRPTAYVLQVPQRSFVGYTVDFTLAYQLEGAQLESGQPTTTRLVSRARVKIAGRGGHVASRALLLGDGVMVRRQLLGIKKRCESI